MITVPCRFKMAPDLRCPVCCGSLLAKWGKKNGFSIFACKGCTHVFVDLAPESVNYTDPSAFRAYMTCGTLETDLAYYRHLCEAESEGGHTNITTSLILRDLQRFGHLEAASWLDIGSGSGYLMSQLKRHGFRPIGVEAGGWGTIAAKERGLAIIQGILRPDTFPQKFDFISATDVLEHQPEPRSMMELIRHYLSSEGRAYLSFPFADSIAGRVLRTRWPMVTPPTHCGFFTHASFSRIVEQSGLRVNRRLKYSSSGFRGRGKLRLSLKRANQIRDFLGLGDQVLYVVSLQLNR